MKDQLFFLFLVIKLFFSSNLFFSKKQTDYETANNIKIRTIMKNQHFSQETWRQSHEFLSEKASSLLQQGNKEEAASFYKKAVIKAVEGKNYIKIREYNERIYSIHNTWPDWAKTKLEELSVFDKTPGSRPIENELPYWEKKILLHLKIKKFSMASSLTLEVIEQIKKHFHKKHPQILPLLYLLAEIYQRQIFFNKAEKVYRELLDLSLSSLGEDHPNSLKILDALSMLYHTQGLFEKAQPLIEHVYIVRKEVFGEKHPESLFSLHRMAASYKEQKQYAQAHSLLRNLLRLKEQVLGEKHFYTLASLKNQAFLYYEQGLVREAQKTYEKVIRFSKEIGGEENFPSLPIFISLNQLYNEHGLTYRDQLITEKRFLFQRELTSPFSENFNWFLPQPRGMEVLDFLSSDSFWTNEIS